MRCVAGTPSGTGAWQACRKAAPRRDATCAQESHAPGCSESAHISVDSHPLPGAHATSLLPPGRRPRYNRAAPGGRPGAHVGGALGSGRGFQLLQHALAQLVHLRLRPHPTLRRPFACAAESPARRSRAPQAGCRAHE